VAKDKRIIVPPYEQQVIEWLKESGLNKKLLPGEIVRAEAAYKMFYHDIDGERDPKGDMLRQLQPVNGLLTLVNWQELPKYRSLPNELPRLYYPPNFRDWRAWVNNPRERKFITEGWKKAVCATLYGFKCVALQGCWSFMAKNRGVMLLDEFTNWLLEGAHIYWIPDRDRKKKSIQDVLRASNTLALRLQERGARVHVVELPILGDRKVGLDDFFDHYSRQGKDTAAAQRAFEDLIASTGEWKDFELNDIGNARRFVSMYGSQLRYVDGRGYFNYESGLWRLSALRPQECAKNMIEELIKDARDATNLDRAKVLKQYAAAPRIKSIVELAESDPHILTSPDQLDRNPLLVNTQNCTLELPIDNKGQLHVLPHRPEDLLTKQVAVDYDPNATCPLFLEKLDFWAKRNKDLQRTIQQLLGLSCTGVTQDHLVIFLYGPGASGKTTLIETISSILGDYACTFPADTFLVRRYGRDEERKVASLPGVRFAIASETEQTGKLDETLIKRLAGGDSVSARRLYEEQFTFKPEAKIWIRTNYLPTISGTSDAIWRRIVTLKFDRPVPDDKKDSQLPGKLKTELPGIFTWMIRGYLDYAKNGLFIADAARTAKAEYQYDQDVLAQFLESECEFDETFMVGRDELYIAYDTYIVKERKPKWNKGQFKKTLLERYGNKVKEHRATKEDERPDVKQQARVWKGIKLKRPISVARY
jgi:P4 family phage/plasmid primase-like protien